MSDTHQELVTLIDRLGKEQGVNLVSDDAGKWAVSDCGIQPLPEGESYETTVGITSVVDPEMWKPSILEALRHYYETADKA